MASPPGKKLQNVLLLSGGEKALTALALLVGIFQFQPSPFCVLDEVDAALDETNVGRFADLLHSLSKETQFLLVTHSKRMMQCRGDLRRDHAGAGRLQGGVGKVRGNGVGVAPPSRRVGVPATQPCHAERSLCGRLRPHRRSRAPPTLFHACLGECAQIPCAEAFSSEVGVLRLRQPCANAGLASLGMTALQISSGVACVDRLPLFDKHLHPAEHSYPTVPVALRLRHVAGKSIVADPHRRTCPSRPSVDPSAASCARRALPVPTAPRFSVLESNLQSRCEPGGEAGRSPGTHPPLEMQCRRLPRRRFATCRQGAGRLSSPLTRYRPFCPHHKGICWGSSDCLKYSLRRGGNKNFRENCVIVGGNCGSRHDLFPRPLLAMFLSFSSTPGQPPA